MVLPGLAGLGLSPSLSAFSELFPLPIAPTIVATFVEMLKFLLERDLGKRAISA